MTKWGLVALLIGGWIVLKWVIARSLFTQISDKHVDPALVPVPQRVPFVIFRGAGELCFWAAILVAIFG